MPNNTEEEVQLNEETQRSIMFKEIDIIQNIIKRMASNSFLIKGWTLSLIVITMLLKGNQPKVIIAFIPLFIFWGLDAYFLRIERRYRELFNWVIDNRMSSIENIFKMDYKRFNCEVKSYIETVYSTTLFWFYGSITILLFLYCFLVLYTDLFQCFMNCIGLII